jgi:hypothetical protein
MLCDITMSIITFSVIKLSVIALGVIMLSVIAPSVIMLNVVAQVHGLYYKKYFFVKFQHQAVFLNFHDKAFFR